MFQIFTWLLALKTPSPPSPLTLAFLSESTACQAPPSMEFFQARMLDWVAIPFFGESSRSRDPIQGSNPGLPHCRQILYHLSHQGRPSGSKQIVSPFFLHLTYSPSSSSSAGVEGRGLFSSLASEISEGSFRFTYKMKRDGAI